MHLEFMRDQAKEFPVVANPHAYRSARIWHCKFKSLGQLHDFVNLRSLEIAGYPDSTLAPIATLSALEALKIVHLPHIESLEPLQGLANLRLLSLATLPSWDSSGKVTIVDSLKPLTRLPGLTSLELLGILPKSKTVDDLLKCHALKQVRISKYPKGEHKRIEDKVYA